MLLVMLAQAILIAVAATFGPLYRLKRDRDRTYSTGALVAYFAALGFGFILLEVGFLQRFVLFLGFPTYSLSVVLFSLLLSTGLGSAFSSRFARRPARAALVAAAALAGVVPALVVALPWIFTAALDRSLAFRIIVSVTVLFPLGTLLGMFFPLGIRVVEGIDRRLVPWAWAVNGCTTVIGTVVAAMLGMTVGFTVVMMLAAALYAAGSLALLRVERPVRT